MKCDGCNATDIKLRKVTYQFKYGTDREWNLCERCLLEDGFPIQEEPIVVKFERECRSCFSQKSEPKKCITKQIGKAKRRDWLCEDCVEAIKMLSSLEFEIEEVQDEPEL